MADIWEKLNNNGQDEVDSWLPQPKDEVIGTYLSKKENVGKYHKNIYILEKEDGSKMGVWGTTQIDRELAKVKVGDVVKLVYLGKVNNPKTGNNFHSYDVYIKRGASNDVSKQDKTVVKEEKDDGIPF